MSGFLQEGAIQVFTCQDEIEAMRSSYELRRNQFIGALNQIPGVSCAMPEGAFYAWVRFDVACMDAMQMCQYLMDEAGVVGMPGSAYGEEQGCYMRFSFASSSEDLSNSVIRIDAAMRKLLK